jgi:hypothetical protein
VGTSSPFARFSIQQNASDTGTTVFAIASSTATATTTLFAVSNAGVVSVGDPSATGDAVFQFANDPNAWSVGYYASDKSFRIASSTALGANVALSIAKGGNSTTTLSGLNISGAATSTSNVGFNITSGCYAVGGVCLGTPTVTVLSAVRTYPSTSASATTTYTWTKPAGTQYIEAEIWGAGGGAGGTTQSSGSNDGGGGGGGGGASIMAGFATSTGGGGGGGAAGVGGAGGKGGTGGKYAACGTGGGTHQNGSPGGGGGGGGAGGPGITSGTITGGNGGLGGASATTTGTTIYNVASSTGNMGGAGGPGSPGVGGNSGNGNGGSGGTGTTGSTGSAVSGGGGGAGGYTKVYVSTTNLPSSITLQIGCGGNGGSSNTGPDGNAGQGGVILIYEYANVTAGADLAELYPADDTSLESGDIVAFSTGLPITITRADAAQDRPMAGIISSKPGLLLKDENAGDTERPVALAGRVPAKVNLEGGPIAIGDRIALSSVPGVGRKATPFENSVGVALEAYTATSTSGMITVFIDLKQGIDAQEFGKVLLGPAVLAIASSTTAALTVTLDTSTSTASTTSPDGSAASSTASTTPARNTYFDGSFVGSLLAYIAHWLADAGNGIADIFADTVTASVINADQVNTKTLCLDGLCVTKDQLQNLLNGQGSGSQGGGSQGGSQGGGSTPSVDPAAPVISINGNNPAHISVGSAYADLGASVTDDQDHNLGYYVSVDGGATTTPDQVSIDTSAAATHTIVYSAMDSQGNTSTATRTVIVEVAAPPPAGDTASSTPPVADDTSTSTPPTLPADGASAGSTPDTASSTSPDQATSTTP